MDGAAALSVRAASPATDRTIAKWFACIALVVYLANGRELATGDSFNAALMPVTLILDGTISLERFRGVIPEWTTMVSPQGWLITHHPPFPGLILTPAYVLPVLFYDGFDPSPEELFRFARRAEKLAGAVIAALAAGVFFVLVRRLGGSRKSAVILTIAFAFGSQMFSTASQALWQHGPGILFFLLAMLVLTLAEERPRPLYGVLFGVFAGLSVMMRLVNAPLIVALYGVLLWRHRRLALIAALPALAIATALFTYNIKVLGSPFGIYGDMFTRPVGAALPGLLVSPGRGLLVYFPVALIAVPGAIAAWREPRSLRRTIIVVCGAVAVALLILISTFDCWWGGASWGARLLSEVEVLLLMAGIPALDRWTKKAPEDRQKGASKRRAAARPSPAPALVMVAIFTGWSVVAQAIGTFLYVGAFNHTPRGIDSSPYRNWDWRETPFELEVRAFRNSRFGVEPPVVLQNFAAEIDAPPVVTARPGEAIGVRMSVKNTGTQRWSAYGDNVGVHAVNVAYRMWSGSEAVQFDGPRSKFPEDVGPGESESILLHVTAPEKEGRYRLDVTLVQEGITWFDAYGVVDRVDLYVDDGR